MSQIVDKETIKQLCLISLMILTAVPVLCTDGDIRLSARTGPVASAISPNWRLALSVEYELDLIDIGFVIDLPLSRYTQGQSEGGEVLVLNSIGFMADVGYRSKIAKDWALVFGSALGARSLSYETDSDNSNNPTDWIPFIPSNPLGSQMYFVASPYAQVNYAVSRGYRFFVRIGYELHVGQDYRGIQATDFSGFALQLGVKVPLSVNP